MFLINILLKSLIAFPVQKEEPKVFWIIAGVVAYLFITFLVLKIFQYNRDDFE